MNNDAELRASYNA